MTTAPNLNRYSTQIWKNAEQPAESAGIFYAFTMAANADEALRNFMRDYPAKDYTIRGGIYRE